jgi:hypothetical protein
VENTLGNFHAGMTLLHVAVKMESRYGLVGTRILVMAAMMIFWK